MTGEDWSREEVEATVADYLAMLALELSGSPYSKASHRRALKQKLNGRSEGYDILSYEPDGSERLIEVKTTKYGRATLFFATANEVAVSEANSVRYFVYRLYQFRDSPSLYTLPGAISTSCSLAPVCFKALPR